MSHAAWVVVRRDGTPRPRTLDVERMRANNRGRRPATRQEIRDLVEHWTIRGAEMAAEDEWDRAHTADPYPLRTSPTGTTPTHRPREVRTFVFGRPITAKDVDALVSSPFAEDWTDPMPNLERIANRDHRDHPGWKLARLRAEPWAPGPLGWVHGPYPMADPSMPVPLKRREREVLRDFQGCEGITVDGVMGPQSWNAVAAATDFTEHTRRCGGC